MRSVEEPPESEHSPATRLVIRVELPAEGRPKTAPAPERTSPRALPLPIAAIVLVALGWLGYRMGSADSRPPPVAEEVSREASPPAEAAPAAEPATAAAPAIVEPPAPQPAVPDSAPVEEVLPQVPRSALDTIRGTIRVSMRAVVDQEGTVSEATSEVPGPSRYFERLSLEASRKWRFAPAPTEGQRVMRIRFNYTRSGVTAGAEPFPAAD